MKHIFQYFSVLLLLLTVSCQDDEIMNPQRDLKTDEHLISFSISESVAATRAMGEQPSKESLKKLHVLVFDENGLYWPIKKLQMSPSIPLLRERSKLIFHSRT